MANLYAQNPLYIDTAFASFKAAVASILGTLFSLTVVKWRWVGPAAVGDQVEVVDPQSGRQILLMRNTVANGPDVVEDWSAQPRLLADFGVPLINSGKLFVYIK